MLFDRIDHRRLQNDIAALAAESRELKRLLSATWARPMADEQRRLARVRRRATELHILLAWSRGRCRARAAPRGEAAGAWDAPSFNARVAERIAPDYARADGAEARTP